MGMTARTWKKKRVPIPLYAIPISGFEANHPHVVTCVAIDADDTVLAVRLMCRIIMYDSR